MVPTIQPVNNEPSSVSTPLRERIGAAVAAAGGWLPFDEYMRLALYTPGLGYYARGDRQFGRMPASGSDFVTAPELSPLFARALAVQLRQALRETGTTVLLEFGAGSGALAEGLLDALGGDVTRYAIVEVSAALRARQQQRLQRFGDRVRWLDAVPPGLEAVVIGNEVLDAMPVQLLAFDGDRWHERGVSIDGGGELTWSDRPSALRPPVEAAFAAGSVTELHTHAQAFVASLASWLQRGAAFFIDYGFPETEYHHPQRSGGTLMCHRAHRADSDPLRDPGDKDITAHVDFTAIALAAQEAGLQVLGYTSQARFLFNTGIAEAMAQADARERAAAHVLVAEHEMGELFKVLGLSKGCAFDAVGFAAGDRTHRL